MFKKIVILTVAVILLTTLIAYGLVDTTEVTFSNVNAGDFDQKLRGWFEQVNEGSGMAQGFAARGEIYYVDGNKSTAGTGTGGWDNAFNTLSAALLASHTEIGVSSRRKWAGRNTIFVMGDTITEDLTALAQKTDIVGVGNNNPYNKAAITGNHIIPSTTAYPSCRFFNMQFFGDQAAALWDVTSQGGLEFHNCLFQANGTATIGLEINNLGHLKLIGNWFGSPDGQNFTASAIKVENVATGAISILIKDNYIHSNGIGIDWDETTNVDCWIDGNRLFTGGMVFDTEDVTEVMIVDNLAVTLLAAGDNTAYDINLAYAAGNTITANNDTKSVPSIAD